MIASPFPLLRPFDDRVDLRFLAREDAVHSNDEIAAAVNAKAVVGLHQEHGNRAVVLREPSSRAVKADAVFTDRPGLTLTIRFADCQGAVIVVPQRRIVGLVHAGWRGVQSRVMSAAYALLLAEWGVRPSETRVGLGPSLCADCADFTDPAREVPGLSPFIRGRCVDLRAALDAELGEIGVPAAYVERMPGCTRCSPERYWTYRGGDRDAVKQGFVNVLTATIR